jgi:hypothetical protein
VVGTAWQLACNHSSHFGPCSHSPKRQTHTPISSRQQTQCISDYQHNLPPLSGVGACYELVRQVRTISQQNCMHSGTIYTHVTDIYSRQPGGAPYAFDAPKPVAWEHPLRNSDTADRWNRRRRMRPIRRARQRVLPIRSPRRRRQTQLLMHHNRSWTTLYATADAADRWNIGAGKCGRCAEHAGNRR